MKAESYRYTCIGGFRCKSFVPLSSKLSSAYYPLAIQCPVALWPGAAQKCDERKVAQISLELGHSLPSSTDTTE